MGNHRELITPATSTSSSETTTTSTDSPDDTPRQEYSSYPLPGSSTVPGLLGKEGESSARNIAQQRPRQYPHQLGDPFELSTRPTIKSKSIATHSPSTMGESTSSSSIKKTAQSTRSQAVTASASTAPPRRSQARFYIAAPTPSPTTSTTSTLDSQAQSGITRSQRARQPEPDNLSGLQDDANIVQSYLGDSRSTRTSPRSELQASRHTSVSVPTTPHNRAATSAPGANQYSQNHRELLQRRSYPHQGRSEDSGEAGPVGTGMDRRASSASSGFSMSHSERSRGSVASLRAALQTYRVGPAPSSDRHHQHHNPSSRRAASDEHNTSHGHQSGNRQRHEQVDTTSASSEISLISPIRAGYGPDTDTDTDVGYLTRSRSGSNPTYGTIAQMRGLSREMMDAVVEIHRVLYRGNEDLALLQIQLEGDAMGWPEQEKEIRRVVNRWFESDAVYDHPLIKLTSRQSLSSHFLLLHLLSTLYIPSVTPSSLLQHAKTATTILRTRITGWEEEMSWDDVESGSHRQQELSEAEKEKNAYRSAIKGKQKEHTGEYTLSSVGPSDLQVAKQEDGQSWDSRQALGPVGRGWWRFWDVDVECLDIGGMDCYDGYHQAMIDQVFTLTLLPSLLNPSTSTLSTPTATRPSTPTSAQAHDFQDLQSSTEDIATHAHAISRPVAPSFPRRLVGSLLEECEGLLRWDLRVRTVVEFNEVGKVTHMRDLIDIRDAIEAVVPFAKRLSWVTRRLAGLVTSTIGAVALGVMSGNQAGGRGRAGRGKRGVMMSAGGAQGVRQIDSSEKEPVGLGLNLQQRTSVDTSDSPLSSFRADIREDVEDGMDEGSGRENTLGLDFGSRTSVDRGLVVPPEGLGVSDQGIMMGSGGGVSDRDVAGVAPDCDAAGFDT